MALLQSAELIAAEIKRRLLTCTVAQGAETDIGLLVLLGKQEVDKTRVPCISVIEGDDVVAQKKHCDYGIEQRYVLVAVLPCDIDEPNTAAHAAIRDMKRAIFNTNGTPDYRWNGQVANVKYVGRDIIPRPPGEALVQAIVEVAVEYVENVATP